MPDQSNEPGASWWAELQEVKHRLEEGDARMSALQAGVDENTRLTKETNEKATEIFEFLTTMKSLLKLGNMLSSVTIKVAKPISYVATIVAAVATAWAVFRSGK